MVIVAFTIDIRLNSLSEILNADLIVSNGSITPVLGCLLAHVAHFDQRIDNTVLT